MVLTLLVFLLIIIILAAVAGRLGIDPIVVVLVGVVLLVIAIFGGSGTHLH